VNRQQRRAEKKAGGPVARPASSGVPGLFAAALHHHEAGRLDDAERLCRQILAFNPRDAESSHLLGRIAHRTARRDLAVAMISQAIAVNPDVAGYHADLGTLFAELGRLDEAAACYGAAIAVQPTYAAAHFSLGNTRRSQGRPKEAIACYRAALALKPDYAAAHNNLGGVLEDLRLYDEAIACHRAALALRPDFPEAQLNLGVALQAQGKLAEAVVCYRAALALRPDFVAAQYNLGNAARDQGKLDEAVACLRAALTLRPDFADAHNNLGKALGEQGRLDEALACYREALALGPDVAETHNNLGSALQQLGRLDEAIACYRSALQLDPELPDGHFNLALALLARGDMAEGWREHEWRWKTPQLRMARRDFAHPQWRGEAAPGRTLLIHAEQGFGDTLQFCRYAPLAAARGPRVILEVPKPLVRLLRCLSGVDQVVAFGETLPPFDLHCPMLSLPLALRTTLETVPGTTPYLQADPARVEAWQARLIAGAGRAPRVGLVWAGNPRNHSPELAATDRRRSLPPERLASLFDVPGVRFFSLQKAGPLAPESFSLADFMAEMEDFADTAALVANLDLVISVDTAVVHLAAALGKPVWVLDRFDSCWRWLGRRDSPWYPTLRLYRQPRPGDWNRVLAEVTRDLRVVAA
jgi:tetratricopeptide (TPR) repeat protein